MLVFLKCVAQAVMENGLRGLADMVPGGAFAYDVAKAALEKYREARQDSDIRADIQQLAQASFTAARQAAEQVAQEFVGGGASEDEITNLELYLAQIPSAVRQSQKRPEDPTGTTIPATFTLRSPDDVLKLLPPKPVQFRPGSPLPERSGWVLTEPLGVGGFGEVWLARHHQYASLTRAVKFCRDLQARDRDLLHESRVIDRVMHEGGIAGIVPLLDAHLDGKTPWLMFEYVAGGDLGDVINEWQSLPQSDRVARALAALHELAVAVGHFHRLTPDPVVHRDLKPANILRDKNSGKLRVTDFGIGGVMARAVLELETRGSPTRGGRLLSCLRGSYTPLYASPQQQELGDPDPRDDVHALGVIGYQMITGQVNRGAGPDFADDLRDAGVGEALIALLGRCVATKAEKRPKDAVELAEQLAALTKQPTVAVPANRVEPLQPSTSLPPRSPAPPPVPARATSAGKEALRELLDKSPRFFLCNTNRRHSSVEAAMRQRKYAAAWETFAWPKHMQRVREGDTIFMWGKGAGIIGIGRATGKHETKEANDPDRIRSTAEYAEREWRVPVEWLIWVEDGNACPCDEMGNCSFKDVSKEDYRELRDRVRGHFLGDS
jgi:serine/threonine protein kinase